MLKLLFAPVLVPAGLAFTLSAALAQRKAVSLVLTAIAVAALFYIQFSIVRSLTPGLGLIFPQALFAWPVQALALLTLLLCGPIPHIRRFNLSKPLAGAPLLLYVGGLAIALFFGGLSLYGTNVWAPPLIEASCVQVLAGTPENIVRKTAELSEKHLGRALDFSTTCQALQEGS